MSWAERRRLIILSILGAIAVAFFVTIAITVFYKTPTCTDGIQNQGEVGIDCGGSCAHLCALQVQPPVVLFTKAIVNNAGRTDIVAAVENKNVRAQSRNVPYRITLYGIRESLIQELTGVLDLPPGATTLVYLPGVMAGNQKVTQAFLSIESSAPYWLSVQKDSRLVPTVANTTLSGATSSPRIDAVLSNDSVIALYDVPVIVLVHNDRGDVIAVSKTIVPTIPAQGNATAVFTWNAAFSDMPTSIEVIPIVPLPS